MNGFLLTRKITDRLNKGFETNYHISADSVGRICAQKFQLQRASDKNHRGWIITPDILSRLKSVYGLTAPTSARTLNPHQPGDAGTSGTYPAGISDLGAGCSDRDEDVL